MTIDQAELANLVAIEAIRKLPMLYARGVDRKDYDLVRSLYADDCVADYDGVVFETPDQFVDMLRVNMPRYIYTGHHMCNHLIEVDGDTAEGEVYTLAYHVVPDGKGGLVHDKIGVRYIDRYRKENGRWLFAARSVRIDWQTFEALEAEWRTYRIMPDPDEPGPDPTKDASYSALSARLFRRGPRA
jgi:hypothetical protein